MTQTLYVTFSDANQAEKAVGALLDYGVLKEDVTVIADHAGIDHNAEDTSLIDDSAKTGISTTTPEDAGAGAARGAGIGLGVGVLAGLAALTIPGIGLVIGGGALASAIAAAAATTAAGAVAGGVTGYLKDQGLPQQVVDAYSQRLQTGGSLVALTLPSGGVDVVTGRDIAAKYGGADVNVY
jgi:hypothetical protein